MARRLVQVFVSLGVLLTLLLSATSVGAYPPPTRYFAETGHSVSGAFLEFFDRWGGVYIFGYPLTEEILEGGTTVQYFERARMEWHPQNPDPYKVQLGLLGYLVHGPADPPVPDTTWGKPNQKYFPETGHIVKDEFLIFYNAHGGLTIFGYPITEEFISNGVTVQWFQRARMERHPSWPERVRLGKLGQEWLDRAPQYQYPRPPVPPPPRVRYFPETGYTVQGPFLDFYERYNSVVVFGYPISPEYESGGKKVQWFQKARLELVGDRVQLGLLGTEAHGPADPPVHNWTTPWSTTQRYFEMTGHVVSNAFLEFFNRYGGVDIFGYPISEAQLEGGRIVQWFQRAKMEWRPEARYDKVQLALLGSMLFRPEEQGRWEPGGEFGMVWNNNPGVKAGLGLAVDEMRQIWAAEQTFEAGYMFWRSDNRKIYVLKHGGYYEVYDDTWYEGDPVKWGYRPPPGRYEPIRGFGKVWREKLGGPWAGEFGWAIEPERGFVGMVQTFERGLMFWSDRRWVYVLYNTGMWERYQDMYAAGSQPAGD